MLTQPTCRGGYPAKVEGQMGLGGISAMQGAMMENEGGTARSDRMGCRQGLAWSAALAGWVGGWLVRIIDQKWRPGLGRAVP